MREQIKSPTRCIPLLTEDEIESIRTPQDVIRMVAYNPDREYVPLPNASLAEAKQRDTFGIRIIILGAACFTFGLSVANCMILLNPASGTFALISVTILGVAASSAYRAR
jgi:hypothetical protein